MTQTPKEFAEKLNKCLDQMDAPASLRERSLVLKKMFKISEEQAIKLVDGKQVPDKALIEKMAEEFEEDVKWLSGEKSQDTNKLHR